MIEEIEEKLYHDLISVDQKVYTCDIELLRLLYIWNEKGIVEEDLSATIENLYEFLAENALRFSSIDGYVGIFWFFRNLESQGLFKDDFGFLPQLKEEIDEGLLEDFTIFNLDPLYGIPGKALIYKDMDAPHKLNEIISYLRRQEEEVGIENLFENSFNPETCLSYAHGWPGVVAILCQIHPLISPPNSMWLSSFLKEVGEMVAKKAKEQFLVQQNLTSEQHKSPLYKERLAWCYGDFGIALMFKELLKLTKDQKADDEMKYFLNRTLARDKDNAYLNRVDELTDIGICHGLSGLFYLNHHFAEYTQDKRFSEKAQYWWLLITDEFKKHNDFRTVVMEEHTYVSYDSKNFLEGKLGLALILQSFRKPSILPWPHLLMIF